MPKYDIYAYPIWAPVPEKITTKEFPNEKSAYNYMMKCAQTVYNQCASDKIVDSEDSIRKEFFAKYPDANETSYSIYFWKVIQQSIKCFIVNKEEEK